MSIRPPSGDDLGEALAPLGYIDALAGAGGIPLCVPPHCDYAQIRKIIPFLKGFLFIGGADYRPEHYGGHSQPEDELMPPRRDRFDIALAGIILKETDLPVLGICGGCQLLSIARGGALIQDIATEWQPRDGSQPLPHSRQDREIPGPFLHDVRFTPGSLAARATGTPPEKALAANSFHHQAVRPDRVGRDFIASAWSADGIIEAIEPAPGSPWAASGRFVLGVQWHPERMQNEKPHQRLFAALVKASGLKGTNNNPCAGGATYDIDSNSKKTKHF
jgi:putative glutamine amidotransferase